MRGRAAHESVFNTNDGEFRCPNSQQGYSPVQHLDSRPRVGDAADSPSSWSSSKLCRRRTRGIRRQKRCRCHDAGRCGSHLRFLHRKHARRRHSVLGHRRARDWPSSVIGRARRRIHSTTTSRWIARRLRSLRKVCCASAVISKNERYWQAGLTVANTLFDEPYLSTDPKHQGIMLHAVYHRPNNWDFIPQGGRCPPASPACGAIITRSN